MANDLAEVRTVAIETTGRSDLTDAQWLFYIRSGQLWLDGKAEHHMNRRRYQEDTENGTFQIRFTDLVSIDRVYAVQPAIAANVDRVELERVDLHELRQEYAEDFANETVGRPVFYARNIIHLAPGQIFKDEKSDGNFDFTHGEEDIIFDEDATYDENFMRVSGILIMPPADGVYTIEVWGKWRAAKLSADTDFNIWTQEYPDMLVAATQRSLDMFYRNLEGVRAMEEMIMSTLVGLDMDLVDQNVAEAKGQDWKR